MKKDGIFCLIFTMAFLLLAPVSVFADTLSAGDDWVVTYGDEGLSTNFATDAVSQTVSGVMPGDTISYQVTVKNEKSVTTDWYMTNSVIASLEDDSATGGAYTYQLLYTGSDGTVTTLYDSDTVGGDGSEGLMQVNTADGDYFYLERLTTGESGTVSLNITLDGNTQSNSYMSKLAQLQMNFSVEETTETVVRNDPPNSDTTTDDVPETGDEDTPTPTPNDTITVFDTPKTGDTILPLVLSGIGMALGILLLVIWALSGRNRKSAKEKITLFAVVFCTALSFSSVRAMAAGTGSYTYTVTIRAAGDAVFDSDSIGNNIRVVTIDASGSQKANDNVAITTTDSGKTLKITGIDYEERVLIEGTKFIGLSEESKYYVKGVRFSGQDGETASFDVKKDLDLVVSYGVAGNMVEYTINYLDADGNVLAESATYYGQVGDKPVISYRYIEGYVPQAYNLTKTLGENAAENVFDFVYTQQTTPTYTNDNNGGTEETPAAGTNDTTPDTTTDTVPDETPGEGGDAAGTPAEPGDAAGDGGAAGDGAAAEDGGAADDGAAAETPDENVTIEDEETPQGAQEIVDLDDEEVPLAGEDPAATAERLFTRNMIIAGAMATVAAAGIITVVILSVKRRKIKK